jgi:uroporphyrinogen decarboxylase
VSEPLLVRALRRERVERTPVWFMRQAGRSLPEYRAIRERHGFFDIADTPELCAEVTLQPVRRHGVDAAVMFADIMTPVRGMGLDVALVEGVGPVLERPIRTRADVERIVLPDPEEAFAPVLEAVRLVRAELPEETAVIGFCGGPFTVASYLVEGRASRELARTKALLLSEPATWDALLEKLSATFAGYVAAKVRAGADAVQLFDSWAGTLSPRVYRECVAPWSTRVLEAVDAPTIHFATGAAHLLDELLDAGGDAVGLDWRVPLDEGWAHAPERAVQGNLDPAVLLAPWEVVEREALDVLARAGGRPGHVFNLGHGVLPETDPDVLTRLVALVRERTEAGVAA